MVLVRTVLIITLTTLFALIAFSGTAAGQTKYSVTDLGTLGGTASVAYGINASGQVVGWSDNHAFRTAPTSPINPVTDDLGTLGGEYSQALGINASGQVVGADSINSGAFRTAANSPINPATDDLGTLGGVWSYASGINASGQVVGDSVIGNNSTRHAFRTAANSPINPATDDLGTLGGTYSFAFGINASGQVAGYSNVTGDTGFHAFRTAPNSPINPATDDLGTLGGTGSYAYGINASGQAVGMASINSFGDYHAFRTAANSPINPATDDLGTLGGAASVAYGINASGQVVGQICGSTCNNQHAFVYFGGVMHDLNNLIPAGSGWVLVTALGINDAGQIVGAGSHNGENHGFLLTPIFAETIVSTFGAGDTFNTTSQYIVGSNQAVAVGFTPSANLSLTKIELPMRSLGPPNTTSVIIKLLSDASGKPGTELESWTVNNIAYNGPPSKPNIFSLPSVVKPVLNSGSKYWVAAYQNSPVNDGWSLSLSSAGFAGFDKSLNNGSTWSPQSLVPTPAYRVSGTPTGTVP